MFGGWYQGKRVLVTGHTGFKGGWLSLWLSRLGAETHGLGLPAPTQPSFHELLGPDVFQRQIDCDIRDLDGLTRVVIDVQPDIVFHLAAQALVRRSYADPMETFSSNATGTAHVMEAIRRAELGCAVVVVTSDKCYENREWAFSYRENDAMGGHDIYSMSKGVAELVVAGWNRSFFQPNPKLGPVATARAGNVIGGGDYAADRIVPDCMRALAEGRAVEVRNPAAVRPWQHVLECLSGYLWLGARLSERGKESALAGPFNFGPEPGSRQSVRRLVEEILRTWPGSWEDRSDPTSPHEATLLALSIEKAAALLDWRPTWAFPEAVEQTVAWYRRRHVERKDDLQAFSIQQIETYASAARAKGVAWASA